LGDYPEICPDGTGGFAALVRRNLAQDHLIGFRLDSTGWLPWGSSGIDFRVMYWAKSLACPFPYIYIAWDSGAGCPSARLAKLRCLDYQGNSPWPENITLFSGTPSNFFQEMKDGNGTGSIFSAYDSIAGLQWRLYMQKFSYYGDGLWEQDVPVTFASSILYPCIYANDFGGGILS